MARRKQKRKGPVPTKTDLKPGTQKERELRASVATLERQLQHSIDGVDPEFRPFLERLIRTMSDLTEISDPARSSPIEAQMAYKHPDSSLDEGRDTRWARALMGRIRSSVNPLLWEYEQRVEGTYKPPIKPEKVRCANEHCDRYGKRLPRFIGPGNSIELVYCEGMDRGHRCGRHLIRA